MTTRPPELQVFLDRLFAALDERLSPGPARALTDTIFAALKNPAPQGMGDAKRLPVCDHLPAAFAGAERPGGTLAGLANALKALDPALAWERRWTAKPGDGGFYDGHANANIVGPQGIERRDDVWIGVSLMAPRITYPDHHHPPEEVYIVLSRGEWRHGGSGWFEPGLGGLVYNVSDTVHAMRSGPEPLLAIWSLWIGDPAAKA